MAEMRDWWMRKGGKGCNTIVRYKANEIECNFF